MSRETSSGKRWHDETQASGANLLQDWKTPCASLIWIRRTVKPVRRICSICVRIVVVAKSDCLRRGVALGQRDIELFLMHCRVALDRDQAAEIGLDLREHVAFG